MSDDDEMVYVKRQKTIHYGSLDETIEGRMKLLAREVDNSTSAPVNTSSAQIPEYFDIDLEMQVTFDKFKL